MNEVSIRILDLPYYHYSGVSQIENDSPGGIILNLWPRPSVDGQIFIHNRWISVVGSYDRNTQEIYLYEVIHNPGIPPIFYTGWVFSGVVLASADGTKISIFGTVRRGFFDQNFLNWNAGLEYFTPLH